MQMLASQFTHEMLALGADNLSSGHLFRYWRAAPPPALAAQKVDFSKGTRRMWGERGERQLKVESRAKMNHSAAYQQVCVWTDQHNLAIVFFVCVFYFLIRYSSEHVTPTRWGWVDGGRIFSGGCWLTWVFSGCLSGQVLPSVASLSPFCPPTISLLVSCSSVFFLFPSFIACAPFTFLFSPLPQSFHPSFHLTFSHPLLPFVFGSSSPLFNPSTFLNYNSAPFLFIETFLTSAESRSFFISSFPTDMQLSVKNYGQILVFWTKIVDVGRIKSEIWICHLRKWDYMDC